MIPIKIDNDVMVLITFGLFHPHPKPLSLRARDLKRISPFSLSCFLAAGEGQGMRVSYSAVSNLMVADSPSGANVDVPVATSIRFRAAR